MTSDDLKNTTKDIADKADRSAHDAAQTAQKKASQVADNVQDYAGGASAAASDLYGRAQSKIRDMSDGLPDSAAETFAAGQDALNRGGAQLARQVAKQPIEALLLAGAIGYLVGWATNRS